MNKTMNKAIGKEFLNRFSLLLIISAYIGLLISLYNHLILFLVLFGLFCAVWRILNFYGRISLVKPLLLNAITIITALFTVLASYQSGFFSVMLHLIILGFSLKFLELKSIRDVHFFVHTGFLLIALFLIFNSSIVMTLAAGAQLLILLAVLLSLHATNLMSRLFFSLLLKSCLLSLPLALLLFIIIPRLPPLWKMPLQKQAVTGLSTTVSPGEIASLSRSSELAFRVSFDVDPVAENERYWRVLILDNFDGQTWSQSEAKQNQEKKAKSGSGYQLKLSELSASYELILEPHYNYWIPSLDHSRANLQTVNLNAYELRSIKPVSKRTLFAINLYQKIKTEPLTKAEIKRFTQLPLQGNRKTRQWLAGKRALGLDKKQILTQLLTDFSTQNYRYTLTPPVLGIDQVDDFLFSTQAGFCVHYASSFLYAARSLAIPARMVTGYLGGEWQADGEFLSIRQYDAHAWVEIWQDENWLRVDPTAYVAPQRVELGLLYALSDRDEFLADEYLSLQRWRNITLLNELRGKLAQLDYLWAVWVVNYDNKKQLQLMKFWFAKFKWLNQSAAFLLIICAFFMMLFVVIFKPWSYKKTAQEDKLYLRLQKYYNKKGVLKAKGQTVTGFCLLASRHSLLPVTCFEQFSSLYNCLKYQVDLSPALRQKKLQQLDFLLKQLQTG